MELWQATTNNSLLPECDLAGENLSDEARAGITFVDQLAPEIVMATLGIRHVGEGGSPCLPSHFF